VHLIY